MRPDYSQRDGDRGRNCRICRGRKPCWGTDSSRVKRSRARYAEMKLSWSRLADVESVKRPAESASSSCSLPLYSVIQRDPISKGQPSERFPTNGNHVPLRSDLLTPLPPPPPLTSSVTQPQLSQLLYSKFTIFVTRGGIRTVWYVFVRACVCLGTLRERDDGMLIP